VLHHPVVNSIICGTEEVLEAVEDVNTQQFHHPHIFTKDEAVLSAPADVISPALHDKVVVTSLKQWCY
jgi:hypothetical protein